MHAEHACEPKGAIAPNRSPGETLEGGEGRPVYTQMENVLAVSGVLLELC